MAGPNKRRKRKDPTNHGFWNPPVSGAMDTGCRILMWHTELYHTMSRPYIPYLTILYYTSIYYTILFSTTLPCMFMWLLGPPNRLSWQGLGFCNLDICDGCVSQSSAQLTCNEALALTLKVCKIMVPFGLRLGVWGCCFAHFGVEMGFNHVHGPSAMLGLHYDMV